ncbi:transposase [Actinoallomurus oryzae]|uniref:transposase n=1 Tax=Actinoallomurus oryzae TaxID=502180 RepID=UPI003CD0B0AB
MPASSGKTTRHRLNRGGDRALNRAIHAIALTRIRQLPPHPRLHRPPHRRRQDPTRDPPLPQALHRPRALPNTQHCHDRLTNVRRLGIRIPPAAHVVSDRGNGVRSRGEAAHTGRSRREDRDQEIDGGCR